MKDLIQNYLKAKEAEKQAQDARIALELEIAALLDGPSDGQKTHTVDGYKVTVSRRVNRSVDWDAFDEAMTGAETPAPVIIKRELDTKGLRWYADQDPDRYFEIQKAITEKPGKPSVTAKEISDGI